METENKTVFDTTYRLQTASGTPWLMILLTLATALAIAVPGDANATSLGELRKLTASDSEPGDLLGKSAAVSGEIAVVGAWKEDTRGASAGAAYVYLRNLGGADHWGEARKLTASDGEAGDRFGISVAASRDIAVVGAYSEDTAGADAGAAYVFQRNAGGPDNWGEVKKLCASDGEAGDRFGVGVAISGDTIVVGASEEDVGGVDAGAAYVFLRNEGGMDNWGEVKKLVASDAQALDNFGGSVAAGGDTVVVGAVGEDDGGTNAGAAYLFQRDEGGADNWGEVAKLIASDAQTGDWFGVSVAVSGGTAVVGALGEDAGGTDSGAAYVFQRDESGANSWSQVSKVVASDAQANDWFGASVALSGDMSVVGSYLESDAGTFAGAAYVFQRDEGGADSWGEVAKLTASDAHASDFFGTSVAVSGETAIVGAESEDAGASNTGAAYVYDLLQPKRGPVGDADCSGSVTSIDAALVLQLNAGLIDSLACPERADANQNGELSSIDAALILQLVAGLVGSPAQ